MPREIDTVQTIDSERFRWTDFVKPFEFIQKEWQLVRPVGPVWTDYRHTITTKNGKRYVEYCHAWDTTSEDFVNNREDACDCCRLQIAGVIGTGGAKIMGQYRYYLNVFHYVEDDHGDLKNQGLFLLEMSSSLFKRVQELKRANGNFPVTHPERGAMVLIKFDKNQDPANMYSASLDTKNSPLTPELLTNTVLQRYPDGSKKKKEGDGKNPAFWEYIRTTSTREEMRKSLRTQGYYANEPQAQRPLQDFSKHTEFAIADDMPETPAQSHLRSAVSQAPKHEDEAPAPRPKKALSVEEAKQLVYEGCPTTFGDFAGSADCYSLCKANMVCKAETDKQSKRKSYVADDDDVV